MKLPFSVLKVVLLVFVLSPLGVVAQKNAWPETSPAELAMAVPVVETSADAEALNWEVRIEDEYYRTTGYKTTLDHYLKVKVFTELGREKFSKFEIPFGKVEDLRVNVQIKDIAARTITPDGKVHDVKAADIFDQDSVKADGVKLKVKSFAMPAITKGSIVEFRWREIRSNSVSNYVRIHYFRDIPVHRVKYSMKPVVFLAMRIHSANITSNFVKEKGDFYTIVMSNVPALRPEPRMRAPYETQPWSLIYYADPDSDTQGADKYWASIAKETFEDHVKMLKYDDTVKQAALQAIAGANSDPDKVRKVFDFCRRNIKNVADDADEKPGSASVKPDASSSDVLKQRAGTWHDLNMLFGSMLNAVGIDARVARATKRNDPPFDRGLANGYFIRTELMAAKVDGKWRFFDFSNNHLPFGMIPSSVESQTVLISGNGTPEWAVTEASAAESSMITRTGNLELQADGSIGGSAQISYSGHIAGIHKERLDGQTTEAREKWVREMISRDVHARAEVSSVSIANLADPEKPLIIDFKITVPGYADATGKRLFLRPNIFKRSAPNEFTTGIRYHDVSFDYRWMEHDLLKIKFPTNFQMEDAAAPDATADEQISIYNNVYITSSPEAREITYNRKMKFEGKVGLQFDRSAYPRIKGLFDSIGKANEHLLSLRQP